MLILSATLGACGWLWPLEGEFDPHRCEPACQGKQRCQDGRCVGPGADGALPDRALKPRDGSQKKDINFQKKDKGKPPPDKAKVPLPDKHKVPVPDKYKPPVPDTYKPPPDKALPKDTGSSPPPWQPGFGAVCNNNAVCGTGFFCRTLSVWPAGYCTKSCQKGSTCPLGPPGTWAQCNVTTTTPFGDLRHCEFMCGKNLCPSHMGCDKAKSICFPNALAPNP